MRGRVRSGVVLNGTYRIIRLVGEGGMGEVYEARHARLAGRYAVKVLHSEIRKHPEILLRFQREAQITSALRHPGIVQVIDFNTAPNGAPYLVMEYLEGEDLGQIIERQGALALPRVVDVTVQIAAALSAAHRKGVVHRDLKPQNIFVLPAEEEQPERVKVLDFGISKIRSVAKKLTGTAVVLGTPQFMAPEQAEGREDLDAAADQFSLAAIVYEMLTGRPAFSGDTLASVVYQIVHADPIPVTRLRPNLPAGIQSVMARALAKNRQDRFASVSEFARALDQIASTASLSDLDPQVTDIGRFAPSVVVQLPESAAPHVDWPPDSNARPAETLPYGTTSPLVTTTFGRTTGELVRLRKVVGFHLGKLLQAGADLLRLRKIIGSRIRLQVMVGVTVALVAGGALVVGFAGRSSSHRRSSFPTMVEGKGMGPTVQLLPVAPVAGISGTPAIPAAAGSRIPGDPTSSRRSESTGMAEFELASDPPGLAVWVDDKPFPGPGNQALTRMRGLLAPGVHTLALTKAGFEPWRKQVDMKADASNRFIARLKKAEDAAKIFDHLKPSPASDNATFAKPTSFDPPPPGACAVTIGSTPWSKLWVDGKDTHRHTPVVQLEVPCGVRRINLRRPDLAIDFQTEVTLTPGDDFRGVYQVGSAR